MVGIWEVLVELVMVDSWSMVVINDSTEYT